MTTPVLMLMGITFGSCTAMILALYLYLTRSARQARNVPLISLGYFLFGGSALGGMLVLLGICDRSGVARQSSEHYLVLYSYAASLAIGVLLTVRAEIKWRKARGSHGAVGGMTK